MDNHTIDPSTDEPDALMLAGNRIPGDLKFSTLLVLMAMSERGRATPMELVVAVSNSLDRQADVQIFERAFEQIGELQIADFDGSHLSINLAGLEAIIAYNFIKCRFLHGAARIFDALADDSIDAPTGQAVS